MIKCKQCKSVFDKQYIVQRPIGSPYKAVDGHILQCPLCMAEIDQFELTRTTKGSELLPDASNYDKYQYEPFMATTDNLICKWDHNLNTLVVLMIERKDNPFKGLFALPGGFVDQTDAEISDCASRELKEEAGLKLQNFKQFKTYGSPTRDPRGYVISTVFYTVLDHKTQLNVVVGSDANSYKWHPVNSEELLAFDHKKIIYDFVAEIIRSDDLFKVLVAKSGIPAFDLHYLIGGLLFKK